MPGDATKLIGKYCAPPGQHGWSQGETAPLQDTPAKMQNHRTEAFIDGIAYFNAIKDEIQNLLKGTDPNRFFYMAAWWLGLSSFEGTLRVADGWNFENRMKDTGERFTQFDDFALRDMVQTVEKLLKMMVDKGVNVRVLPWVLPLIIEERIADKTGMGSVCFHSLVSVASLRRLIGEERVVVNLLSHTFGGVHCKMVVCGDSKTMRAYTSGLDPVSNRLLTPGLTRQELIKQHLATYKADNSTQLEAVCGLLNLNVLTEPLFDLFKIMLQLPDFLAFQTGKRQGKYDFRVEVRWENKEWKLTLEDGPNKALYIFYLQRVDNNSIKIYQWPEGGWHDVGVRVEGRAAGAIHDFFRDMWNEQLGRRVETFKINDNKIASHNPAWQPLAARQPIDLPPNTGEQYVQVLRTVPAMNFTLAPDKRGKLLVPDNFKVKLGMKGHRLKIGPQALAIPVGAFATLTNAYSREPLNFAPHGCFEFKVALHKAISEAMDYIFIADQSLYALEIMDWINQRIQKVPSLKVILMYGADPADPPNTFLPEAMNNHLLPGVRRISKDGNQPRDIVFYEWTGNAVHCKVTIIDDTWCAIGSANCMRRSLYTDVELSVSILEAPTPPEDLPATPAEEAALPRGKKAPSFVQRFRRDLWAHYCGIPLEPAERSIAESKQHTALLQTRAALAVWNPPWGWAPTGVSLRPEMSRQNLQPFPLGGPYDQKDYDRVDPDSRQAF
jgi:phosphatidylserine/phosphatidylglycerophosphate/cardiolipin synthase-like enzyme